MFTIFQKKEIHMNNETQIRMEVMRRAEINKEARKMAQDFVISNDKKASKTKIVSTTNALTVIDQVLDKVVEYENVKITALTELYLALESGETKNLIEFLKKKEKTPKVSKKEKQVYMWKS